MSNHKKDAISPDGNHVYVSGRGEGKLAVFSRNATTGVLTFVEVHTENISTPQEVTVSPDGANVYLATAYGDNIIVYTRNATTGQLTFLEQISSLDYAISVNVSPDSNNVYVTHWNDYAISVYGRNTSTGALTFVESFNDPYWGGGIDGLEGPSSIVISPDNNNVYVAGRSENCIVVFSRNTTDGTLTLVEKHWDNQSNVDGLNGVNSLVVSPNGESLYAVSDGEEAIAVFNRNTTNGTLSFVERSQTICLC